MMIDQTLLPPNSTPFERAIEAALKLDCPVATGQIWNPATCPVVLLPWLAWALSVDTWDAAWPEAIQRRVIANSPAVHRAKGTRAAIIAALDGLMVRAGIREWWQDDNGAAGTFIVRAYASSRWSEGAPLITPELTAAIHAVVMATAPLSRPFEVQVGVAAACDIGVAACWHQPLKLAYPDYVLAPTRALAATIGVAGVVHRPLTIIYAQMEVAA